MSEAHSSGKVSAAASLQETTQEFLHDLTAQREGQLPEAKVPRDRGVALPMWCSPSLGWPLLLLLLLILAFNGYLMCDAREFWQGSRGVFLPFSGGLGAVDRSPLLPPLWSYLLLHASSLFFICGALALLWHRLWGFHSYLIGAFAYLLFCAVPQFEPLRFAGQVTLFLALAYLVRRKWDEFD